MKLDNLTKQLTIWGNLVSQVKVRNDIKTSPIVTFATSIGKCHGALLGKYKRESDGRMVFSLKLIKVNEGEVTDSKLREKVMSALGEDISKELAVMVEVEVETGEYKFRVVKDEFYQIVE